MLQYILQFCCAPGHKLLNHCRSAKNDAISNNAKTHKTLLIYLRVTEDMSTKLSKEHRSATDKATAEKSSIFGKNTCVSARWFASCDDHHILHTGTWLRDDHSVNCCSKSCYTVELQVAKCKKICQSMKRAMPPQVYKRSQEAPYASELVSHFFCY